MVAPERLMCQRQGMIRRALLVLGMTASAMACGGEQFSSNEEGSGATGGGAGSTATGGSSGSSGNAGAGADGGAGGAAAGAGAGGSGGSLAGGGGVGGSLAEPPCPPPQELFDGVASCEDGDAACTFGEDTRPWCRDLFFCSEGSYQPVLDNLECAEPAPDKCPDEMPITMQECGARGTYCEFGPSSYCQCTACGQGNNCWRCATPPPAPCPLELPNSGEPCELGVSGCPYGDCSLGVGILVSCVDGYWQWEQEPCPEPGG